MAKFNIGDLVKKKGKEGSAEEERTESRAEAKREGDNPHPGFKAVEKKIGANPKIRDPGAVLAAASRGASAAAKAKNPRLKKVKG